MSKLDIATIPLHGCFGCHIAFLDLHEELLDVLNLVNIKYSPIMDIKEIPKVDLALVEGSVVNSHNEHILKEAREKTNILVAFGTCACFGGIQGLRNLFKLNDVLERAYIYTESTVNGKVPSDPTIPTQQIVKPLEQVVKVDYYIPGCPPVPSIIKSSLVSIINGKEPEHSNHQLCHSCSRYHESLLKPQRGFVSEEIVAPMELEKIDTTRCFLEQGILCMGLVTREGCETRCIKGNMPCRGCMGPTPDALEQGAKLINSLASILPAGGLMFMEDMVGTGYRYSLPVSIYSQFLKERS